MKKTLLAGLILVLAGVIAVVGVIFQGGAGRRAERIAPAPDAPASGPAQIGSPPERPPASATPAHAHPESTAAAPVWSVDKAASRLAFRGVMNGAAFDGVFRVWDAQIAFDPRNLKASRATITVDTTSALTGEPLKDQALPNSEWLSTLQFPSATLVTRSITQVAPGRYLAVADVRIRGVSLRTTVPFSVSINHDMGHMEARLMLDRRIFHIGEGPFRSPPPVAPQVQITLRVIAKKTR